MSVTTGTRILASEYETLRTAVNRWFADNYAGSIAFGNSNQTYGWGGAAAPAVSGRILPSNITPLTNRCNIGVDICNSVTGYLSPPSTGVRIEDGDYNDIETKVELIRSNRLNIDAAELSTTNRGSSVRSTTWSGAIDATFRFTFLGGFDDARYFFNSGGAFYIYGTISGYSTGTGWDGAGFNQILTNMGTVYMDYTQVTQTGAGGSATGTGYYNLITSYANIFNQTGTGAYTDATLYLAAKRSRPIPPKPE